MIPKFKTTSVFTRTWNSPAKIIINRGGTRSSKTFSIAQILIIRMLTEPDKRILVSRKTFPALRMSAMDDIIKILKQHNIYDINNHNRTEHVYRHPQTDSEIHFSSIDDPQKFRGPEWNYEWMNEMNEFTYEDFRQLHIRLTRESKDGKLNRIYGDFNPDDEYIWIKTELEDQGKADIIHSTFKDNNFLNEEAIKNIESYMDDKEFWKIYGLGEYGEIRGKIYDNYETSQLDPQEFKAVWYGIDWGYTNDPTALVRIGQLGGKLYVKELIYETNLTNQDIIKRLQIEGVSKTSEIFADSAEPKSIEEIYRSGYNIKPAPKGRDSVNNGIDVVKRWRLVIQSQSSNLIKELRSYKWKEDKTGKTLNVPIDMYNHALDAVRYAIASKLGKPAHKSWVDSI